MSGGIGNTHQGLEWCPIPSSLHCPMQVLKSGIVENCIAWAQAKSKVQLNKMRKGAGPKNSRLRGIAKLDDANSAGGRNARDCTLIVTEGDSAKALAVSGLGVVGRDSYGVFPLRGKLLNVREATHKQVGVDWCVRLDVFRLRE